MCRTSIQEKHCERALGGEMIKYLLILGLFAAAAAARPFNIPDVQVEVYYPRGLRVSVPDVAGMKLFSFHGNVNRRMNNLEVGDYTKDVLKPINGRWVYEDKVVRLKRGDQINYWLYVMHERLGYRKDSQHFTVNELIHGEMPELMEDLEVNKEPNEVCTEKKDPKEKAVAKVAAAATAATTTEQMDDRLQICESAVLKLAPKLISLEAELDSLRKSNDLLTEIVESSEKKLTLRGRISRQDDPGDIVKFIIYEKLDLRPEVLFAERIDNTSIRFRLGRTVDMVNVLTEARKKLKNSKVFSISL